MHMLSALIRRTLGKKPSEETVLTQGRKQFVDHLVAPNRGPYSGPLFDFKSLITNSPVIRLLKPESGPLYGPRLRTTFSCYC